MLPSGPELMRAFAISLVLALGCSKSAPADKQQGGGQMPPTEVTVVTIAAEKIALKTELSGRTTVALESEVRPQITGIVTARTFTEGAKVKAGQVLYQIDPSQYQATLSGARADIASARAGLEAAKLKDERYASLSKIEGVSKQEADDARLAHDQAVASLAQKQAALQTASINVGYTSITAPISGHISKSSVTRGALVTAGQVAPLATIRSLDPIYVDLVQSSEQRMKLRAQVGSGALQAGTTAVELVLPDGTTYGPAGTLEFAEVAVDEATGTVTLRAKFPNPDETLLPGMYVRARLEEAVDQDAILAPQQGVTHDPKGNATAMVVGADNKVELRTLSADRAIGDRWLVERGLKPGDKLIVEGLNKIGPGMIVHPNDKANEKATAGAGSAGSAAPAKQ
ncbi:efflux RND transporter periplasmic adaptor subunit [soil metagenome]